jgi:ribosomal protein S18 acetylase RimI-like enzyme
MKYVHAPHGPFSTALLEDGDFARVKVIYNATFARHNDADFAESWHDRNRQSSMGLFYKATLIGFGIVVCEQITNRLAFLAVDTAYRGSGAGSQLLEALLATLDHCYLVPVNNLKVIDWYYSHGLIRMEDGSRTYAADEAHFVMTYMRNSEKREPLSPDTISLASPTISRESSGISVLSI